MNKEAFLKIFSGASAQERKIMLRNPKNRALIAGTGANVTMYCGTISSGKTIRQKLSQIYVGLIERLNSRTGAHEGYGATGGLAETISANKFYSLSLKARKILINHIDNIILDENNQPRLTTNQQLINQNNLMREVNEELGNLGIYNAKIDFSNLEQLNTDGVTDDNYAINIWKGQGNVLAITPQCYRLRVTEEFLEDLHQKSLALPHEVNSEAKSFIKMPIFEALGRFGKRTGKELSEDGRDMCNDYRYPHEWLQSWKIATDALNKASPLMVRLATEVQNSVNYPLSFTKAAHMMDKDLNYIAEALEVSPRTIQTMENNFSTAYLARTKENRQR